MAVCVLIAFAMGVHITHWKCRILCGCLAAILGDARTTKGAALCIWAAAWPIFPKQSHSNMVGTKPTDKDKVVEWLSCQSPLDFTVVYLAVQVC